jgi:hypothetical protein
VTAGGDDHFPEDGSTVVVKEKAQHEDEQHAEPADQPRRSDRGDALAEPIVVIVIRDGELERGDVDRRRVVAGGAEAGEDL